jgi:hypothetical protein
MGGHLATCTSAAEYEFVRDQVVLPELVDENEFGPFLGGELVGGNWQWVTGEPWEYTAWGAREPNGDAGSPWLHIYKWCCPWWNDTNGFPDHRSYVVEWDADCTGNGIVDFGQILTGELIDANGNFIPDCCELGTPCSGPFEAVEWPVSEGGNGHWYLFNQSVLGWTIHRDRAAELGAHLATVTSPSEQAFIETVANLQEADIWLGGESIGPSGVVWITGEPFVYSNWMPGGYNPGGGYAIEMCARAECPLQFGWNIESEQGPDFGNRAIYEWSVDCNGDGVVDFGQILAGELADADGNFTPDCCEMSSRCLLLTPPVQWTVGEGGNGHWYARLGVSPSESAEEHFELANSIGAHTATITSAAENEFCFGLVGATVPLIGVRKEPGNNQGAWITGERWSFVNWQMGEGANASERYALLPPKWGGLWQDTDLTPYAASLVEWSADCNGDGVVDYGQILAGELPDANANNIPDCCEFGPTCLPCAGDVTGNGVVDGVDLAAMLGAWGTAGQGEFETDVNSDGLVDGADLAILLGGWGRCP